jgi:hypothetical protein
MVFNSDAALDLGPVAKALPVPLRYTVAVPIFEGDRPVGVVALYGTEEFSRDHARMVESAAQLFADSGVVIRDTGIRHVRSDGRRDDSQVH